MEVLAVSALYFQRHWTIPAFDQPAVEEGKMLAKKYLTGC
jgi:glucose-6-phosphate isomerase